MLWKTSKSLTDAKLDVGKAEIYQVKKKYAFCEVRNDLGGSQKNVFFDFLIIQIVLNYGVQERSEAHSSRPRTQLS